MGRWARKPVNHTSWVAVVTPTDRPKSVRNRCLIELFCGVVCVVTLPFWHFCWCRGFCHRTESDLFLFLFVPMGKIKRGSSSHYPKLTCEVWKWLSKTVVCIVSTRSYSVPKLTLTFDPKTQNQWGSSSHNQKLTYAIWKWLDKNCNLYHAHKVLYTKCQSWPWTLIPWPKIHRVHPLIVDNLHVQFESDWAKTVVFIMSTRSYTRSSKVDVELWPRYQKINGVPPLIIYNLHIKFESLNCSRYGVHKVKRDGLTHPRTHSLTQPPMNYIPSNAVARG